MDAEKLKEYAILLEEAIRDNTGKSKDVDFLVDYQPLVKAIADAKAGGITSPRDMGGLGRWQLESNIQDFKDLSERLAQFSLLLRGWSFQASAMREDEGANRPVPTPGVQ